MLQSLLQADGGLLLWIQENLRNPVLTPVMRAVTALGNYGIFWIALTLFLLIFPKTRKAGILSAIALTGSLLINNILLKPLVARIRPYEVIQGLELLVAKEHDFSFPSGHAGASFASAWALRRELPRPWSVLLLILAVVMTTTAISSAVTSSIVCTASEVSSYDPPE